MRRYYIDENNSGGSWWLTRKDYEGLFAAGWKVDEEAMARKSGLGIDYGKPWLADDNDTVPYGWRHDGVYLEAESIRDAVDSFNANTSKYFWSQGCNCCGVPFSISTKYGDEPWEYISGSDADIEISSPW